MPTWLITGCSTGLGRALAQAVLTRGWNAVVTARDPAAAADIVAAHPETAFPLALDVRDPEQVRATVSAAEGRFGGVDVLVNNAGHGYRAAVEEGADTDVADLFATNVFGVMAMTKAALPGMRARRQGAIVTISSVAGRTSGPGSGYYSASKFAVEGLSDALRQEVEPLGIRVLVVEPGGFRTDFAGRSLRQSAAAIDDYAQTAGQRRKENDTSHGRQPGDPERAAQAIITAVEAPHPPVRLVLGRDAFERIRAELDAQQCELEAWRETALETDFPPEEAVHELGGPHRIS